MLFFQVSIVSNSGLNMITSGCYVNKPELGADCTPRLLMEGGNQSSFTCCNSDRCNDDTLVQGKNSKRAIVVTTVVRIPVPFGHTVLKFSRSPYLDNHLSESICTCTIDTL